MDALLGKLLEIFYIVINVHLNDRTLRKVNVYFVSRLYSYIASDVGLIMNALIVQNSMFNAAVITLLDRTEKEVEDAKKKSTKSAILNSVCYL